MAWHKFLLIGLVGTGVAVGCTVTTSDGNDDDGGGGGSGDDAGTGGSSGGQGGASTGGAAGGGGVSTGGASTGGGGGAGGAPAVVCNPSAAPNDCQECLESVCCDEFKACAGSDDCTGTTGAGAVESELACYNDCMIAAATADSGAPLDWRDQSAQCANGCANGSVPADETQDAITCILDGSGAAPDGGTPGCSVQCYGVDLSNL